MSARAETWRWDPLFRLLAFLDNTGLQIFDLAQEVSPEGVFVDPERVFAAESPAGAILASAQLAFCTNLHHLLPDSPSHRELLRLLKPDPNETGKETKEETTTAVEGMQNEGEAPDQEKVGAADEKSRFETVETTEENGSTDEVGSDASPRRRSRKPPPVSGLLVACPAVWRRRLRWPHSFADFRDAFDGAFSLAWLWHVKTHFGLTAEVTLPEQFLIDGVDGWLSRQDPSETARVVRACGVHPATVASVEARGAAGHVALIDLIVEVIFPTCVNLPFAAAGADEQEQRQEGAKAPLDWVLLSYQKNRETVVVDRDETTLDISATPSKGQSPATSQASPATSLREGTGPGETIASHEGRTKTERTRPQGKKDDGVADWVAPANDDDGIYLTEHNIEEFMRERPALVPWPVLRERRRAWQDVAITRFELEHHYTLRELQEIVRTLASLRKHPELGARAGLERSLRHPIPETVLTQATRAKTRAACVAVLLALHAPFVASQDDETDSHHASPASIALPNAEAGESSLEMVESTPKELSPPHTVEPATPEIRKKVEEDKKGGLTDLNTPSSARMGLTREESLLSSAQLVRQFSLSQLQDYVGRVLGESKLPKTKKMCANLIVKKRRRGE